MRRFVMLVALFTSGATIEITEVTNSNSASTIVLGTTSKASINNVVFGGNISGILTKGSQFNGVSVKDSGVSDLQLKDGAIGSGVIGSYGESSSSKVRLSTTISSASLADAASHFEKKLNPASSIVGGAASSSMISGSIVGGLVDGLGSVVGDATSTLTDVVGGVGGLLTGTTGSTPSSTAPSTASTPLTQDQINALIPTLKVEDILGYLKASSISAYAGNITTSGGSNNVDFVDSLYVGGGISTSGGKANVTLSFTDGFYSKINGNLFAKTLIYGEKPPTFTIYTTGGIANFALQGRVKGSSDIIYAGGETNIIFADTFKTGASTYDTSGDVTSDIKNYSAGGESDIKFAKFVNELCSKRSFNLLKPLILPLSYFLKT